MMTEPRGQAMPSQDITERSATQGEQTEGQASEGIRVPVELPGLRILSRAYTKRRPY